MAATALIVDDHAPFRAAARRLLERQGFEVVAEAEDGSSALSLAAELRPDLVLLDVVLPDVDGLTVAERLSGSPSAVVLISTRSRTDFGPRLERLDVAGFISKDELSPETLAAVLA
jgi:DNA-binding NarL/FixJ family response regulator